MLFFKRHLQLPKPIITLSPQGEFIAIGTEVGWLGFPAIAPDTLCFFSGTISAHHASRNAYFIDEVAINGVSGGPVFHVAATGGIHILGIISAYHPNRVIGDTLPGLAIVQDVSHFHNVTTHIHSIEEAGREAQALQQAAHPPASAAPPPEQRRAADCPPGSG